MIKKGDRYVHTVTYTQEQVVEFADEGLQSAHQVACAVHFAHGCCGREDRVCGRVVRGQVVGAWGAYCGTHDASSP